MKTLCKYTKNNCTKWFCWILFYCWVLSDPSISYNLLVENSTILFKGVLFIMFCLRCLCWQRYVLGVKCFKHPIFWLQPSPIHYVRHVQFSVFSLVRQTYVLVSYVIRYTLRVTFKVQTVSLVFRQRFWH